MHIDQARVDSDQTETPRLAQARPHKDLTVTQDETFTGGLGLITMDPESHCMLVEQLAQAREQTAGNACMAPALAQLNCRVMQATSDEAPGRLASVAHSLAAHHSPDFFHGQHELVKAVSGPRATKERAASQAVTDATEQLERLQSAPPSAGEEPAKRRAGRPPQHPLSLEQAQQALDTARRAPKRLCEQRAQVQARIRGIGHDSHVVDRERGGRRNGQLITSAIEGHIEPMRSVAQHEGLSQSCWGRLDKAERVVPTMQATIACVSG